ncbi:DUF5798 family protein [Halorientalis salina]|jgi:uncharacterized coiled-coil DUF342 family protein|uniref:DUF5798 family protein n=1 Tax=Halorientalis salina TaxID=2932266 RepID=UPI0010AD4BCC|nr:DUF5798 family protein [Halorientalis salina]
MVGLGDTKKKIQKMVDSAEKTYAKINELRGQIEDLREKVDRTSEQVDRMDHELDEQRALLDALADEQGIDVEQVLADAAIEEAETDGTGTDTATEASDAAGGTAAEPED